MTSAPVLIYLLHSGNLYGTEKMALATLEEMTEYGANRVVFAPEADATGSVTAAARAVGYRTVNFSSRWELVTRLVPWFWRFRAIDMIGVGINTALICHYLSRIFRVRLRQLQVSHGGTPDSYRGKQRLNAAPVVQVAVSGFVRSKLLAQGVRADRIVVIDNFLSSTQRRVHVVRPAYESAGDGRPIDPARVGVIVVSRIDWIKKVHLLVEALERDGLTQFRFDVYGTGERLDELRTRTAALPNIRFHGYVDDVQARLPRADLLLHLCPEEPFGLVILEAFSSRLVAVVPDAGGAGDLVDDGQNGLRFRADDVDDLIRVLEAARTSGARRLDQLAAAALQRMDDRYSAVSGARRYRQAFALLAEGAGAASDPQDGSIA